MKNQTTEIPSNIKDIIDMFFAEKKLYERMTGVCVPSSITYTKKTVHTDKGTV